LKKITKRIIAGKYKNKVIELPSLDTTRSTKSIVKESFFNTLQFDIIDVNFVEAFGGSGSMGLEALSRGAAKAYFCEIDKQSYKTLQKNCASIDKDNSITVLADSFEFIPRLVNEQLKNDPNPIVVYIDPPFDFRDGMEEVYDKSFQLAKDLDNEKLFMIAYEHKSQLQMPDTLGKYKKTKTKKFGNTSLSYYQ
jgi:16S rRNA (guanine(966)-N(2))-methyltransferase RsmD